MCLVFLSFPALSVLVSSPSLAATDHADGSGHHYRQEGSCGGRVCLFVAVLCALSFVEGISVNGLPNINISNLERRFGLTSRQAGLISSSGEIGAISFVLFVSFYGGRSHRPRVVGGGGFFLGLGCFFFLLPHIFVEPYTIGLGSDSETEGCGSEPQTLNCTGSGSKGSASRLYPLFIVGQALQGIGFTPAFTCGFAYIDDHASSEHTAVYIGITYAITALGVGVGYVMGGHLLSVWVDIDKVDISKIHITNSDKRWVGAWWIGYAICAVLYLLVSCLLCSFPRYLAGSKSLREKLAGLPKAHSEARKSILHYVLSFPRALFNLICNPLYILLVLVGLGDALIVSGIAGFAPKIIEEKFNVKPTESGLIMGTVTLMGGTGGMATGGFLIQRFRLKLRGIIRVCTLFLLCGGILGGGCFFISCPEQRFAGINSIYGLAKHQAPKERMMKAQCNSNCTCTTYRFDPVCGLDGVTYFSSCYAGCPSHLVRTSQRDPVTKKMFYNCSCITESLIDGGRNESGSAVGGQCAGQCPQVWSFVLVLFLGILFTFLTVTPISMAILRCVPSAERSVALGLQWVTLRLLGTIPGPILTGTVLDTSCQLWQRTCNGRGNCWVYDDNDMSLRLFLLWVVVKITSLTLLLAAYAVYAKKGNAVVDQNEQAVRSMSVSRNPISMTSSNLHNGVEPYDDLSQRFHPQLHGGNLSTEVDLDDGTEQRKGRLKADHHQRELEADDCNTRELGPNRDKEAGVNYPAEELVMQVKKSQGVDLQEEKTQGVNLQTVARPAAAGATQNSSCGVDPASLSAMCIHPADTSSSGGQQSRSIGHTGNGLGTSL